MIEPINGTEWLLTYSLILVFTVALGCIMWEAKKEKIKKLIHWGLKISPQFIRYCIIGGTGALINLGLLYFFTDILGLYYMWSAVLTLGIVVWWNFFGNRSYTFKVGEKGKHPFSVLEGWIRRLNGK